MFLSVKTLPNNLCLEISKSCVRFGSAPLDDIQASLILCIISVNVAISHLFKHSLIDGNIEQKEHV